MTEKKIIHVVAGVLRDRDGKILLTERPPGKHLAGLWEFPGGKREIGETPERALRRELHEEIGVDAGAMRRIICFPWHYAEKSILLDVYDVSDYAGKPHGREGQGLRWERAEALPAISMPAADVGIVTSLRLPDRYAITPDPEGDREEFLTAVQRVLDSGIRLIQLRAKKLDTHALTELVAVVQNLTRRAGAKLLLNGHIEIVRNLRLDGIHLSETDLLALEARPLDTSFLVGVSVHAADSLHRATEIGADFAVLGAVKRTRSHPNGDVLGWKRFAELVAHAPFPVYALGGLHESDLPEALHARAQGIAGISGFWNA